MTDDVSEYKNDADADNKKTMVKDGATIKTVFKNSLVDFIDELINIFHTDNELIKARIYVKDKLCMEDCMNTICFKLHNVKDDIDARNETNLLKNSELFRGLDHDKVCYFKNIWRSNVLDKETKETIFKWFDSFMRLVELYRVDILKVEKTHA
jgi:hypothetical protein